MKPSMGSSKHGTSCDCTGHTPMKLSWLPTISQCAFSLIWEWQASLPHLTQIQLFLRSCLFLHSNSTVHILLQWNSYVQDSLSERCSPAHSGLLHTELEVDFLSGVHKGDRPAAHSFLVSGLTGPRGTEREKNQPSYCSLWFHKSLFSKYDIENFPHYSLLHKRLKD